MRTERVLCFIQAAFFGLSFRRPRRTIQLGNYRDGTRLADAPMWAFNIFAMCSRGTPYGEERPASVVTDTRSPVAWS